VGAGQVGLGEGTAQLALGDGAGQVGLGDGVAVPGLVAIGDEVPADGRSTVACRCGS
jgi:hypothetical protein